MVNYDKITHPIPFEVRSQSLCTPNNNTAIDPQ